MLKEYRICQTAEKSNEKPKSREGGNCNFSADLSKNDISEMNVYVAL